MTGVDHTISRSPKAAAKAGSHNRAVWIYGRHAAAAAIGNDARGLRRILASKSSIAWLSAGRVLDAALLARLTPAEPEHFAQALPEGAVHQGLAALVDPLARVQLEAACANPAPNERVVVLDQITDPQNIGAIIRSAAAFGARAVIMQERRTPPLAGALAKAAAGALETMTCILAVNVARSLDSLKDLGYYCAGLAGEEATALGTAPADGPIALVLGAEGAGLRPLVRKTCDGVFRIPISRGVESLNVSTAAAVALYALNADMRSASG